MDFDEAVLRLTIGRSGGEADSMGVEKLSDFAPHELGVKVALDTAREAAGIDENLPQGVGKSFAIHVFEPIHTCLVCGAVGRHDTIGVASGGNTVAIADSHVDSVEGLLWTSEVLAFAPANCILTTLPRERGGLQCQQLGC